MTRITIVIDSESDEPADYWQDFFDAVQEILDGDENSTGDSNAVGIPWSFKITGSV